MIDQNKTHGVLTDRPALQRCPFCGGVAHYSHNSFYQDDSMARCATCGATAFYTKWNKRTEAAPQSPVAPAVHDLLEVARATGLRQHMHGVNATDARLILQRFVGALRFLCVDSNAPTVSATVITDSMIDAYLTDQRKTVEDADRFGRPNIGGLHTDTVRAACRAGLVAAINAAPTPPTSAADAVDAARYRWLRSREASSNRLPHITQYPYAPNIDKEKYPQIWDGIKYNPENLDAAIDAAIAASKKESGDE